QMIDLKRNLFKIDVRAQKDEEKVFMRTACSSSTDTLTPALSFIIMKVIEKQRKSQKRAFL
ncbi:hypothetical protein, partial [Streptococcus pyogenes]|uniref:hypothetical protein n=1 Tax=Streptococcus pyogenes TaxID=1314 RepID=UPI002ACDDE1D